MLRGADASAPPSAGAQERYTTGAAASPAASCPLPLASGARLLVIPDHATTALRAPQDASLADGALVSGRRSFGGANKAVEAEARRALGGVGGGAEEGGAPQGEDAAGKKRAREESSSGGGGGGGARRRVAGCVGGRARARRVFRMKRTD